jgi:endonuclease/exonuclease/phosphatase family metal-dependent hydrolase
MVHSSAIEGAARMVVVGTWNLENLFRPGSEFGPSDQSAYEAKLGALADVINRLAPDVLAVQEVGDPDALADLGAKLDGDWRIETSTVFEEDHPIRVGVLSQLPLSEVEQVSRFLAPLAPVQVDDDGTTIDAMGRGALRVRVAAEDHEVDVVTCHLKSKLLSFPGGRFQPRDEGERARFAAYALHRRAAEAVTVRTYANGLLDGHGDERAVIVLGDLNDEPLAATTEMLLGPPGSEIGTAGFDRPDRGDPWRLWNLAPLIPEERRFTRVFYGRRELIDHILVSRALVSPLPEVDTGVVQLPSITEVASARRDDPASDHAPVVARFPLE